MTAEVLIYNEIGQGGTDAGGFTAQLAAVSEGPVHLRLNSPGGDVFDGIAIFNALAAHPHPVEVTVDGLAASAASFIAMAGDSVAMNRGAQMMIHDAWGGQIGNAAEMRKVADQLDRHSDQIASLYAARAGGTVGHWRDIMRAETWFNADEAVKAGLADKVVTPRARARNAATIFNLAELGRERGWRYPGRAAAPAPKLHLMPEPDYAPPQQLDDMSDEELEQQLQDLIMCMYEEIHHLGDVAEAMHSADQVDDHGEPDGDEGDGGSARDWLAGRPRAVHLGFGKLSGMLAARGAHNPDALAAYIGRKKYGHAGFAALAATGRAKRRVKQAASSARLADFDPDLFRRVMKEAMK